MGLEIKNNLVYYDENSKKHLNTELEGNPNRSKILLNNEEIDLISIFTRLKYSSSERRDRNQKRIGDNCPLIYALKKKNNLYTDNRTVYEIIKQGKRIIKNSNEIKDLGEDFAILCTPSGHDIVKYTSIRFSRIKKSKVYLDVFNKTTLENAISQLQNSHDAEDDHRLKSDLLNTIKKLKKISYSSSINSSVPLKEVPTHLRAYINPIESLNYIPNEENFVIVDDLVSSGSTFLGAATLLRQAKPTAKISCLSLFSKV